MRIPQGRFDIRVPQELLDDSNVRACFQQVRGITMPQRMKSSFFVEPGRRPGAPEDGLDARGTVGHTSQLPFEQPTLRLVFFKVLL